MPTKRASKANPNNVNQKAMLAVADVIEFHHKQIDLGDFFLDSDDARPAFYPGDPANFEDFAARAWNGECGTKACIAGWTTIWAGAVPQWNTSAYSIAREELGLSAFQADRLFYGDDNFWTDHLGDDAESQNDGKNVAQLLRDIANGKVILSNESPYEED